MGNNVIYVWWKYVAVDHWGIISYDQDTELVRLVYNSKDQPGDSKGIDFPIQDSFLYKEGYRDGKDLNQYCKSWDWDILTQDEVFLLTV